MNLKTSKVFDLFRYWTSEAKIIYPNHNFDIQDESDLITEFENTVKSACKALNKEKNKEKRLIIGFDSGFVDGFIRSSLDTHWYFEFIYKKSDAYKEFLAIKAVKLYLEVNTKALNGIQKLYEHLLTTDSVYTEHETTIEKASLAIDLGETEEQHLNFQIENSISIALKNYMVRGVNAILSTKPPKILSEANHLFTQSEINELIEAYNLLETE